MSSSSLCIRPREQQQSWTGGKHYPEFTHSLAVPAGLQAAPWSLPMGFSIIHQCLHYSLYLLAPGKCCLSWVAQGQCATNTVDTGSVLSPTCCLWGDMHLCVVSAVAGSEIPPTHHGARLRRAIRMRWDESVVPVKETLCWQPWKSPSTCILCWIIKPSQPAKLQRGQKNTQLNILLSLNFPCLSSLFTL